MIMTLVLFCSCLYKTLPVDIHLSFPHLLVSHVIWLGSVRQTNKSELRCYQLHNCIQQWHLCVVKQHDLHATKDLSPCNVCPITLLFIIFLYSGTIVYTDTSRNFWQVLNQMKHFTVSKQELPQCHSWSQRSVDKNQPFQPKCITKYNYISTSHHTWYVLPINFCNISISYNDDIQQSATTHSFIYK